MEILTKDKIKEILTEKKFDLRIGWFNIQFKKKYEKELIIEDINLLGAVNDLISFLNDQKIKEILFFAEPKYDLNIHPAILERRELKEFLMENVDNSTNTYIADKDLGWIFTITHENDYFINGDKKLVDKFVKHFRH